MPLPVTLTRGVALGTVAALALGPVAEAVPATASSAVLRPERAGAEEIAQELAPPRAGLEASLGSLTQVPAGPVRRLVTAAYEAMVETLSASRSLEQNLRAVAQAIDQVQREAAQRDGAAFAWLRTGIVDGRAFVAFEVKATPSARKAHPVVLWCDQAQVRDVTVGADLYRRISHLALFGEEPGPPGRPGVPGPKILPESFRRHHPEEMVDREIAHGMTFPMGKVADEILAHDGRAYVVLTGEKKRGVAERLAQGRRGLYRSDFPPSFLWVVPPARVVIFLDRAADPGLEARKRLQLGGFDVRVVETELEIGEAMADALFARWRASAEAGRAYRLGTVTGSTPGKIQLFTA